MSYRTAAWLAWSLCALSLMLTALSLLLLALNLSHPEVHVYFWVENTILSVSFSIIGAIIASRLPANPGGWLFCAAVSSAAVAHLSAEYATYALVARPNSLPAGEALAWLSSWVWIPYLGCIILSLLLFQRHIWSKVKASEHEGVPRGKGRRNHREPRHRGDQRRAVAL